MLSWVLRKDMWNVPSIKKEMEKKTGNSLWILGAAHEYESKLKKDIQEKEQEKDNKDDNGFRALSLHGQAN